MRAIPRSIIGIIIISLFSVSCGGNSSKEKSDADQSPAEASCLADLIPKNELEKMISAEQVAAIVGKEKAKLEFSENKSSRAKNSTIGYEWKSDEERMMVMTIDAGNGREVTTKSVLPDQVDIGNLDVLEPKKGTPLEYFTRVYGPKSKEDKEAAKKAIDRTAANRDDVDKSSAESIKSMVDNEAKSNKVNDVGDGAYWSVRDTYGMVFVTLIVLDGDTMFKITTDVSSDTQEDLRVAKEIAKQIIANCKS